MLDTNVLISGDADFAPLEMEHPEILHQEILWISIADSHTDRGNSFDIENSHYQRNFAMENSQNTRNFDVKNVHRD
jgi:hypothetical protein